MNITRALSAFTNPRLLLAAAALAASAIAVAMPRTADAAGSLSALPADVVVPAGQSTGSTTLMWNTFGAQGAQIYMSVDGGPESLKIANAPAVGAQVVTLNVNHTYLFKMYVGVKGAQPPAATAQVKVFHTKADLTVKYDGYINGKLRITVKNQGGTNAGAYRIAVFAGADSYSIYAGPLAAGASQQFALSDSVMGCNRPLAVVVDMDHQVSESVENNNGVGFNTPCPIDGGYKPNPVNDP